MYWLIGSKGMLGSELAYHLDKEKIPFIGTDKDVDITDKGILTSFAEKHPDINWIINCAAYTDVEKQEKDPFTAERINATGASNIAEIARKLNARLIHISTDYVFDGNATIPYTEEIAVNPKCVYGITKANGEEAIKSVLDDNYWIIRTSWLYGYSGKNFVTTIMRLLSEKENIKVVNDQIGSPTFTSNLAEFICELIEKITVQSKQVTAGIYNYSDDGEITWYDFACEIKRLCLKYGLIEDVCKIEPCKSSEYPHIAERPYFSVLSKKKIYEKMGITVNNWALSLDTFIRSKANQSRR